MAERALTELPNLGVPISVEVDGFTCTVDVDIITSTKKSHYRWMRLARIARTHRDLRKPPAFYLSMASMARVQLSKYMKGKSHA